MKKLFILLTSIFIFQTVVSENINIVFRYDDFRLVNDSTNEKVVRFLLKERIPVVLGVIPCDDNETLVLDKDYRFLPYLKEHISDGSVEIALHGLNHKRMTSYGEFKGLSYEEQYRRIKKGKTLLDSILHCNIVSFIPPWNAHDDNTVKALRNNQIHTVSSSVYDVGHEAVSYPMSIDNYNDIEIVINKDQDYGGVVVVMLHAYDFTSHDKFVEFEKVLEHIRQNKFITFYTFKGLERQGIYVNDVQIDDQIKQNLLGKIMKKNGMFVPEKVINRFKIINTLIYLIVFLLSYLFAQMIISKNQRHNFYQYIVLILVALLIVLSVWLYWLGPIKLIIMDVLLAIGVSLIFRLFKIYDLTLQFKIRKK